MEFVDLLKGVAIFLMVMGHFLAWQWGGTLNSQMPTDIAHINVVGKFIYSFHMPLFFFLSGYVFNLKQKEWSFNDYSFQLLKRVRQLLIPGIVCMVICLYVRERWYFEWFIKALFEIYFVNATIYYLSQKFNHKIFIEIIMQILIFLILATISKLCHHPIVTDILAIPKMLNGMIYYYIGILFFRYDLIKFISRHNSIIGYCLIIWIATFIMRNQGIVIPDRNILTSLSAIIVCLSVATNIDYKSNSKFWAILIELGKYTLPIYLLSPYFIPRGFLLGEIIEKYSSNDIETAIAVQISMGFIVTTYVCIMVYYFSKVLEQSCVTRMLFLGKK